MKPCPVCHAEEHDATCPVPALHEELDAKIAAFGVEHVRAAFLFPNLEKMIVESITEDPER